jgi:hypothetical protein
MARRGARWSILRRITPILLVVAASAALMGAQAPAQPSTSPGRVLVVTSALEGTLRMAGVEVELYTGGNFLLAKTQTDNNGQATFPDVPPGRYVVRGARPGFVPTTSAPFEVTTGQLVEVALEVSLTFVVPHVDVTAPPLPYDSPQPVYASDMLAGSVLDLAPLQGDDFQSLLPLLPGVVRGPDGRLRAKGGLPSQSALQISSTSLTDPTTGDFELQLPGQSLESVELLTNPYLAEYGRFSTSLVQLRTRRGTNAWEFNPGNFVPRFRKGLSRLRGFEPRLSIRGPLKTERAFLSQDFQFRYVSDPVKSLADEPTINLTSFDSFTRIDGVISPDHSLGALMVTFPRRIEHLSMDTFRPTEVTPDLRQRGVSVGVQDRYAWAAGAVLETTVAARRFRTSVGADDESQGMAMIYTPDGQAGRYFNDQERDVTSLQWVQTVTMASERWRGQHLFKFGIDAQHSRYDGWSVSRPVEMRHLDGSVAQRTIFGGRSTQDVAATELAAFAQDRWRAGERLTLEYGVRIDRDDVVKGVTWSPRGGLSLAVLPEGRAILRAGIGTFRQRTPLNIAAFRQFEGRTVTRYGAGAAPIGETTFVNVIEPDLRTPEAVARNVEWNQRFSRRFLLKANYLLRTGSHEHIVQPDAERGEFRLADAGASRYSEFELTTRYLGGERRDVTVSYVHARGSADLNHYDAFYGNLRTPVLDRNERGLTSADVPHRLLVRGTIGLPGEWTVAPVLELRSGFPWSAVDELQQVVGRRNQAGRLPAVRTFDFSLSRRWRVLKYRFDAGVRVYNLFGSGAYRDVQGNIRSPRYGQFFNPIERSIGFLIGTAR